MHSYNPAQILETLQNGALIYKEVDNLTIRIHVKMAGMKFLE